MSSASPKYPAGQCRVEIDPEFPSFQIIRLPGGEALDNCYGKRNVAGRAIQERLVACWNALEGIEEPSSLRKERDLLLEALREIIDLDQDDEDQPFGKIARGALVSIRERL